ncbi:hypothetical protein HBH95_142890 [Parastagonospora nodorum]|nr:hypothetical protein HBH95_142890 [Parastagonospora nodorum]
MLAKSSSVVSNRSIALITNKFSVASLTKPAILNNANIALVDAVHYSVIDALTITLIKDDDDLLGTVNSHIKLRRLRARYKTEAADSRHTKLGKKAQLKKTRNEEELAKAKKEKEEKELTDAYILYFKELLSNNSRIFANAIGIGKTQAIVLAVLIRHFCFFSNSPPENIGRLTKEEAIEMQINTTNAISKALAAANKLTIPEANTPAMHSKATKHCPALSAAQFIIVYSFRKVDKHVFRAYNTISRRTIFNKFHNCKSEGTIIAKFYQDIRNFLSTVQNAKQQCRDILEKEGLNKSEASRRVIFNCFKIQAIASYPALTTLKAAYVKDLFTNLSKDYFLSITAEDAAKAANTPLLPKEVRAKILIESYKPIVQAIIVASIAFAEAITLTEATHVIIIELQDNIIYFNLDSKLELKVLSKQDVKTTS